MLLENIALITLERLIEISSFDCNKLQCNGYENIAYTRL
jgi:hypothetical protein